MFAQFKTLPQLFDFFKDEETCFTYWENMHWGKTGIICPHCEAGNPYKTNRGYKCTNRECQKKFTATVGTIFESSKLPLRTWFGAIYLCINHKKGISSLQLSRDLGIHPKSAWFLLHRIRQMLMEKDPIALGGDGVIVESDTTIVGGKAKNMSKRKRKTFKADKAATNANKTPVTAYVERGGNIRFEVKEKSDNTLDLLKKNVNKESFLMTDSDHTYNEMDEVFAGHETVNHCINEYVREKTIHTNTVEGAFSHFDRMVIGVYHNISRKHMQAYANECAYRYNTRKITDPNRFENTILKGGGIRLKYDTLIAK